MPPIRPLAGKRRSSVRPATASTASGRCRTCRNIGGESDVYLVTQLEHFRSGERQHEQMSIIAEGLSDEDIADIAAWYSSIQFSVTLPQ